MNRIAAPIITRVCPTLSTQMPTNGTASVCSRREHCRCEADRLRQIEFADRISRHVDQDVLRAGRRRDLADSQEEPIPLADEELTQRCMRRAGFDEFRCLAERVTDVIADRTDQ